MSSRFVLRSFLTLVFVVSALMLIGSMLNPAKAERPSHSSIITCAGSIQACIDAASDGDTIVIPEGTYTESLTLSKPVSLTGVNSTTTIIHAVAGQRVLTVTGATISNSVVISGLTFTGGDVTLGAGEAFWQGRLPTLLRIPTQPMRFNRIAQHPYADESSTSLRLLDPIGLHAEAFLAITRETSADSCPETCGGGILINDMAQPSLQNLIFMTNTADTNGGGIYATDALTMMNVRFFNNTAKINGGGAYVQGTAIITGGRFENNHTVEMTYPIVTRGNGLYAGSALILSGTQFINNFRLGEISSSSEGGGAWVAGPAVLNRGYFEANSTIHYGGGLFAANTLLMTDTDFVSNGTILGYSSGAYVAGLANVYGGRFERNGNTGLAGNALIITGTQFISNSGFYGGGVRADGSAIITGAQFIGNNASFGAGLYVNDTLALTESEFIRNTSWIGGGAYANGAATVSGGRFENNSAGSPIGGGGLYAPSSITIIGTRFVNNTADSGGGLVADGPATLMRVKFDGNTSRANGGGLYATNSLDLMDTQFLENVAQGNGGGLFHSGSSPARIVNGLLARNVAGSGGAALYLGSTGSVSVLHTTVADTLINPRSAIQIAAGVVGITNTIIASHCVGLSQASGTVIEDYNLYFNNVTDQQGTLVGGSHSLRGDPAFIDPVSGNYHLGNRSAAIDAGINAGVATDIDGDPRGILPDIGFDEVLPTSISGLSVTNDAPTALGLSTTFTASVTGGTDVIYHWDFGDGQTAIGKILTHAYSALGTYTTSVTAVNTTSGPITATALVTIVSDVPIGDLNAYNNGPTQIGAFTTLSASIATGTRVTYTWVFGDGEVGDGAIVTHTYPALGSYMAIVKASNTVSTVTATTQVAVLTDAPVANLNIVNDSPTLLGNITVLTASVGAGTNVSYTWNLGDGILATGQVVTHTYPATGTFAAIVTATNSVSQITRTAAVIIYLPTTRVVGTACGPTIHACLASAHAGDTVFVPAGVYTESLTLNKPINLLGEDRATTVIRAVAGQRVLTVTGSSISSTVVISGFTLSDGGQLGGCGCPVSKGGGLFVTGGARPNIKNLILRHNHSVDDGGGLYTDVGSQLTLHNLILENNQAAWGRGGGIFADDEVSLINAQLISNTAYAGGGGLYTNGIVTLDNTRVLSNTSVADGGGLYTTRPVTLTESEFTNNRTTGVWTRGGGVYSQMATVSRSHFANNTADGHGGGIYANGPLTLSNTEFISNTSAGSGGGAYTVGGLTCLGCRFIGNVARYVGGGASINVYNVGGTSYIADTEFIGNRADWGGGGIHQDGNAITVTNSRFENNQASGDSDGGGLLTQSGTSMSLVNSDFINNMARGGGGVFTSDYSDAAVIGGRFERNTARYSGGGIDAPMSTLFMSGTDVINNTLLGDEYGYGQGAGVNAGEMTLIGGRFENNRNLAYAGGYGGGVEAPGLDMTDTQFISNSAQLGSGAHTAIAKLNGGRFERNTSTSGNGGGVATNYVSMSGTEFISNTSYYGGGGMWVVSGGTLIGGRFENNRALGPDPEWSNGGGLLAELFGGESIFITDTQFISNAAAAAGGGLSLNSTANGRIVNAVFARNRASIDGAAVAIASTGNLDLLHTTISAYGNSKSAIAVYNGTLNVTDTIITSHTVGISNTGGTVYEDYNLFFGNITNTTDVITSGGHSLIGDPRFVDPIHDDYHLLPDSPAIDHGIDAGVYTDLDGRPRPSGRGFDIGAYEYQGAIYRIYLPIVLRNS